MRERKPIKLKRVGKHRWRINADATDMSLPIPVTHLEMTGRAWANNEGWLHRSSGPAMEWKDGDKEWWKNGVRTGAFGRILQKI